MKKIRLYIATICLFALACTEDKGTYNYEPLNDVSITGIDLGYAILHGQPIAIEPQVKQERFADERILEYVWYAYDPATTLKSADTLAFTKNLKIDSLHLDPKEYTLVFKVKDLSSGIFYDYTAMLSVKGFPDGLQVLSNKEGDAQVSILRGTEEGLSDFEAYKAKHNGEIAGTNPVAIRGINEFMRRGKPHRVVIACNDENLGVYVAGNTFEKVIPVSDAFGSINAPESLTGLLGKCNSWGYVTGVFGGNGNLYTTNQPGGIFGEECNFNYEFANYSEKFTALYQDRSYILYNTDTKGFGLTDSWGTQISPIPPADDPEVPFDVSNTGLDVIYGKTVSAYSMGVFVDPATEQKYLLALQEKTAAFKTELSAENIETATQFEFMNTKQVMYYASGNTIYVYDIVAEKNLYTYNLPAGKTVDLMKVSEQDGLLFVGFGDGTNAANSSSVHILLLDLDGEILDVYEAYDNKFGKIIDFFENY